ncbi:uncharacterized protein LOC115745402 [Rhodamnia argentea]|uniref:Uncharacterized protein LOC115745402 n=1 Tax=Rhodamnia argentea TaxID=178133 RepID=A0A8B8PRC9_9MYRT|nr:uncharacterized protein LOC115745402 [Rhodamnia argentea]
MGIYKFLNLQMIPWCFQLMGSHVSCVQLQPEPEPSPAPPSDAGTVKLILSDGLVKTYHRPIPASELMAQFPKHLVCRSDSFYIGQKIPALSEHDLLQLGHKYFLLPQHLFQSVLTFVTVASFVASQKPRPLSRDVNSCRNAFVRKAAGCQPFDIQRTPSGCLRIRMSDEFISQLMEEGGRVEKESNSESRGDGEQKPVGRVCTTPQLERDYSQLVGSWRRWEPKLETIRESDKKSRSSSSFGMKRRKKPPSPPSKASVQNHHKIQKSSESHVHASATAASTKPSYRAKIKIRSRK